VAKLRNIDELVGWSWKHTI